MYVLLRKLFIAFEVRTKALAASQSERPAHPQNSKGCAGTIHEKLGCFIQVIRMEIFFREIDQERKAYPKG
jgi:hypothetical protein